MLQKLFSVLLIFAISCSQFAYVGASLDEQDRELLSAKQELSEMRNGASFITELDVIIPQLSVERLSNIQTRIREVQEAGKLNEYRALLNYMALVIEGELAMRVSKYAISPEDIAASEKEILTMQSLVASSAKNMMEELMISWEEATHYEEKGNLNFNFDMNFDEFSTFESGITLSNYTSRTQMFDQEFDGEIKAFLKGMIDGESVDIELKTLMDFITKDGNMYLLLEELQLSDFSQDKELEKAMEPFIERLKELGKEKTYLSFEDMDTQAAIGVLQSFSTANSKAQIDTLANTALFEAYSMQGEKYLLRPTMHFCNMGKSLSSVFDPFYGNENCSEGQYEDMLQDFQDMGISMSLLTGNQSTFSIDFDHSEVVGDLDISWEDTSVTSINMNIYDPENRNMNNMNFEYIPKEYMSFSMNADNEVSMNMDMFLTKTGGISALELIMQVEEYMDMSVKYAGENLDMDMNMSFPGTSVTCMLDGNLKMEFAKLDGGCMIQSDGLQYMFPGEDSLEISMYLLVDTQNDNNNLDMMIQAKVSDTEIMKLDVKNTGTRKSISPTEINIPTKAIDVDEAFEDIYQNLYEDSAYDDYGYDPYYSEDENGNPTICETYEYNEDEKYDYCTKYILEEGSYNY